MTHVLTILLTAGPTLTGFWAVMSVSWWTTLILMAASGVGVWVGQMGRRQYLRRRLSAQAERQARQEKTAQLNRRCRVLEKILAVSTRLSRIRNPQELQTRIVEAVAEIGGFNRVVLYLWSDSTGAFEARSFAGMDAEQQKQVGGHQVSRVEYAARCNVRFRFSNSFLVHDGPVQEGPARERTPGDPVTGGGSGKVWRAGQVLVAPLLSSDGEEIGYLDLDEPVHGEVPDVVDLRQLEFLFQHAAASLESAGIHHTLARSNAELQVASEKLNSLNDMKNNFVANVSHELRTPLTSISAYAEMLQQNMGTMSEEVRSEFLRVIHNESLKLTDVINDLLELGNMENGRVQSPSMTVDLTAMVTRLVDSWRSRAQEKGIALKLECDIPALSMPADGLLMQQMLTHLLSNAFKFSAKGGLVRVTLAETGTAVRLSVEDRGIGIPEEKLGRIFDPFYQVDGSATRQHNGQGVGLAICRDIVNHHDGRIWAENLQPRGARFTVLLPRRSPVLQPVATDPISGSPFQPGEFMQRVMHWVGESLGVQTATLMMPDSDHEYLAIRAAVGLPESVVQSARVRRGSGFAGRVWESGQTLLVDDVAAEGLPGRDQSEPRYSTSSLLCVPLKNKDECLGVVAVNNRFDGKPLDADDRLLLESLAPRLAELLRRHAHWQADSHHFAQIRDTLRTITGIGHLRQESLLETCQEICLASARAINMPDEDLRHLAFALQFYDVGLGYVPRELLNKPGPLDDDEQRTVRQHVKTGLVVLEPLAAPSKIRQLILHHHENVDGSGYPEGLAGESIPLGSRLLRLTDTLAALLSTRPWRPARSLDEALEEIRWGIGTHYCPRMAEIFLREAELRRPRIVEQQERGMDHAVFKRPVLDPAQMAPLNS
nr:HD domain-containing phosphohydrolase [Candidatus Krumholzibacteria bacterium]